jgi:hypothetical protein
LKVDPARGAILTAALLCGVLGLSFLSYSPTAPAPSGSSSPGKTVGEEAHVNVTMPLTQDVGLSLRINVSDHGRLISSTYIPHDLLNNNFFLALAGIFDNAQSGATVSEALYNTAGTSTTMYFWGGGAPTNYPCSYTLGGGWGCAAGGGGGLVEVGSGGTAATRSDTALSIPFEGFVATSTTCVAGTTDSVTVSGSENANTGVTLQEAGLFYSWGGGGYNPNIFMLAHDTFPGVVVSAGNTITVQYTLSLNSPGFNYNLCNYLAGALTQPNGASGTVKTPTPYLAFTDTTDRPTGFASTCYMSGSFPFLPFLIPLASSSPVSSGCVPYSSGAQTENTVQICVGTGTTAFVPTSFALSAQTNCNYVTSTSYDSAGNLYVTANIIVTPGATISEAALYITLPNACINFVSTGAGSCGTYGTDTLMFMASTFSGQVVANNSPIGITFQIAASGGS